MSIFRSIKYKLTNFFSEPLSREAFEAYYHRLPNDIEVKWFRDGDFIVGKIKAGDSEYMTQGRSADDFVDMVNDSIITVFDIPSSYYDLLRQTHTYLPDGDQMHKLRNASVKNSVISFEKNEKVVQVA